MEHVNGWCFRGIYKGGLWEDDLHVSARSYQLSEHVIVFIFHHVREDALLHVVIAYLFTYIMMTKTSDNNLSQYVLSTRCIIASRLNDLLFCRNNLSDHVYLFCRLIDPQGW